MNNTLMQWGPIQFQIFPLNVNQYDHSTESDWARKEIAGAATYYEWVGENPTEITLRGQVFPHYMSKMIRERAMSLTGALGLQAGSRNSSGGLGHLDVLDNMRLLGQAHLLIRGDGFKLGWFFMQKLSRGHTHIGPDGIGQQIAFLASFLRTPMPRGENYMSFLWGATNG